MPSSSHNSSRTLEIPGLQLALQDTPDGLDVSLVGAKKVTLLSYTFPNIIERGETLKLGRLQETEIENGRIHSRFLDSDGKTVLEMVSLPPVSSEYPRHPEKGPQKS